MIKKLSCCITRFFKDNRNISDLKAVACLLLGCVVFFKVFVTIYNNSGSTESRNDLAFIDAYTPYLLSQDSNLVATSWGSNSFRGKSNSLIVFGDAERKSSVASISHVRYILPGGRKMTFMSSRKTEGDNGLYWATEFQTYLNYLDRFEGDESYRDMDYKPDNNEAGSTIQFRVHSEVISLETFLARMQAFARYNKLDYTYQQEVNKITFNTNKVLVEAELIGSVLTIKYTEVLGGKDNK